MRPGDGRRGQRDRRADCERPEGDAGALRREGEVRAHARDDDGGGDEGGCSGTHGGGPEPIAARLDTLRLPWLEWLSIDAAAAGRSARRIAVVLALAAGGLVLGCQTTTRVDAGHVGIRVRLAGSDRGIQDMPVVTGWVFFNPLTEQIVLFPTSVQNVVWTASANEGRAVDESITFSSAEGVNMSADIGLSFHIEPTLAPRLYGRFRLNDLSILSDGYMRNTVREAFNDVASKMPVQDIYGAGKSRCWPT